MHLSQTSKLAKPQPFCCSSHPRLGLISTIVALYFLILSLSRANLRLPLSRASQCPLGLVYVYNLPPRFNQHLIDTCNDSDPWNWRCGAVSNSGFGLAASSELAGIVPESLSDTWHWTNQFANEVLYHKRLLSYKCRTLELGSAAAYYIPFYAGLAVGKYLWQDHSSRDLDPALVLEWLKDQEFYRRSDGMDHFITLGRITWDFRRLDDPIIDWGSSFVNMPGMRHVTRLVVERAPRDHYDVGVPYPTGFHPKSSDDVTTWQSFVRSHNRTRLFSFVGAARPDIKNDFRGWLISQCRNESDTCQLVDCSKTECANGKTVNLETFLGADFCLQPRGDSYTRRSVFDCMLAGSIPVFFWFRTAYDQYPWFLPHEPESYSVYINPRDVRNGMSIRSVLEGYSKEDVRRMREKVIESIPKFVYAKSNGVVRDAFDIAIEGTLKRFKEERERRAESTR